VTSYHQSQNYVQNHVSHFQIGRNALREALKALSLIGLIREELRFDSVEKLVRQMDEDSARARAALAAAPDAFPKLGVVG